MSRLTEKQETELAINKLLRELEVSTGTVVNSLELHKLDVSTIASQGLSYMVGVRITLDRLPGRRWQGVSGA